MYRSAYQFLVDCSIKGLAKEVLVDEKQKVKHDASRNYAKASAKITKNLENMKLVTKVSGIRQPMESQERNFAGILRIFNRNFLSIDSLQQQKDQAI